MNRSHGHAAHAAEADRKAKGRSRRDGGENQANHVNTHREVEDIEERSTPRTPVIYEIVRRQGDVGGTALFALIAYAQVMKEI
jgi:hypothetical protein